MRVWVVLQGIRSSLINERIPQRRNMDVLNGIAYDKTNGRLWVTGKLWPKLYEVELRQVQVRSVRSIDTTYVTNKQVVGH
jgi:glutamine cyclotransferase